MDLIDGSTRHEYDYKGKTYSVMVMLDLLDQGIWVLKDFDPETGDVIYSRMKVEMRQPITNYPEVKEPEEANQS